MNTKDLALDDLARTFLREQEEEAKVHEQELQGVFSSLRDIAEEGARSEDEKSAEQVLEEEL